MWFPLAEVRFHVPSGGRLSVEQTKPIGVSYQLNEFLLMGRERSIGNWAGYYLAASSRVPRTKCEYNAGSTQP